MQAPRTIIGISSREDRLMVHLVKTSISLPDADTPAPLDTPSEDEAVDSPDLARQHGHAISKALLAHDGVRRALEGFFHAPAGEAQTLLFKIAAPSGERTRWETLCDQFGSHLALTGRCHVGRIAEQSGTREKPPRTFMPPIRVAAFLSGHGLDATDEWKGLVKVFSSAAGAGELGLRADVYIGQPALLEEAQAQVQPHGPLHVHPMPASRAAMEAALTECGAQIVHFYCHGYAAGDEQVLHLASLADHLTGASGSVEITASEMVTLPALRDHAWVVLLNCCEGAASAVSRHSMAYRLVSEGGVGAAIGMHAPVLQGEASAFSAALYPALFEVLRPALRAPVNEFQELDLARAMTPARRVLRDMTEKSHGGARWSLPVLYMQFERFWVVRSVPASSERSPLSNSKADAPMELQDKLAIVSGLLKRLPPDTPLEVRKRILSVLDDDPVVPANVRPDAQGRFTAPGQ